MPRKRRTLDRDGGTVRDASLVIIASEDKYAVRQYFRMFRTRRVVFKVLETRDCHSSPVAVLERLDAYREEVATVDGDEFWVCIDSDHWLESSSIANLTDVLRKCRQKGYGLAISNPCFELWLLLHFHAFDSSNASNRCEAVERQLRSIVGAYSKNRIDALPLTADLVTLAMSRAKELDIDQQDLPARPVTRVYRLLELLLRRDGIHLRPSTSSPN